MPVESLDAREQSVESEGKQRAGDTLAVVSERNQDLRVVLDALLQHRQRPLRDLVLLELAPSAQQPRDGRQTWRIFSSSCA